MDVSGHFGVNFGSFLGSPWSHFWHLGLTLEPHLSDFDVERPYTVHVLGICAGLVGPKSRNFEEVLIFVCFVAGS